MSHPVIAIGLDAAEPKLVDKWIDEGYLPNIRSLQARGLHAYIENFRGYSAELPWTTFLTGCSPQKTGFWSPLKYDERTYTVRNGGAYAFDEYPPFFALGNGHRVAAFDVPQLRISKDVDGPQVLAWGAHSPQTDSMSEPAPLFDEIISRFGAHPALRKDNAEVWQGDELVTVLEEMRTGIERRADICIDFLQQEPWELFITVFGETHSAGHMHWQLSQADHPLYRHCHEKGEDPLRLVYEDIDRAIGRISEAAPAGARVVVFSGHGMEANCMDNASMVFLPELLYRYNFNRPALADGTNHPLPAMEEIFQRQNRWSREIWASKVDWNPLRRLARRRPGLARKYFPVEQWFGSGDGPSPPMNFSNDVNFIPATWYSNLWPEMKVFALPSFADGYIRVNLRGRDAQGMVDPADYDSLLDDVSRHLEALVNPRTGAKLVEKLIRTRDNPAAVDPRLPEADIIVLWNSGPADAADSPAFGRIGPIPCRRGGSHTTDGFFIAAGEGVGSGALPLSHALDLAPTILDLMGATVPEHLEGSSMLRGVPRLTRQAV